MRTLIFLFLLTTVFQAQATFRTTTSTQLKANEDCKSVQNYILIHGIAGSSTSFGSMKDALFKHIECSSIYEFEYAQTDEDSKLKVIDFAKNLNKFINKHIKDSEEKNINLIMHSQGGIVGLTWLVNAFLDKPKFSKNLTTRINKYASLSTPFNGASIALLGGDFFFCPLDTREYMKIISPFGKNQLVDMQYGSLSFQEIFETLTSSKNDDLIDFLKNDITILNIAGIEPLPFDKEFYHSIIQQMNQGPTGKIIQKSITKINESTHRWAKDIGSEIFSLIFEGDLVVSVPSMKLNFNYAEQINNDYDSNPETPKNINYNLGELSYVIGSHFEIPGKPVETTGVVDIPEICAENLKECNHPGYLTLLNFLKDEKIKSNNLIETEKNIDEIELREFELHIMAKLDTGDSTNTTSLNQYSPKIKIEHNDSVLINRFVLSGVTEDPVIITTDSNGPTAYYVIRGTILDSQPTEQLKISIKQPMIRDRHINVEVEKEMTTFVKTVVVPGNGDAEKNSTDNLLETGLKILDLFSW